jgi:glucose-6-phosphate 1-dehydrogenase
MTKMSTINTNQQQKSPLAITPFNIIVFGGDGDLAVRKIYPALFHRFVDNQLDVPFQIFAINRSEEKRKLFFDKLKSFLVESIDYELDKKILASFLEKLQLITIPTHDIADYAELKAALDAHPDYQNIYYLSTPSDAFGEISDALKQLSLIHI